MTCELGRPLEPTPRRSDDQDAAAAGGGGSGAIGWRRSATAAADVVRWEIASLPLSEVVEELLERETARVTAALRTFERPMPPSPPHQAQGKRERGGSGEDDDVGGGGTEATLVVVHMRCQASIAKDVPRVAPHAATEMTTLGSAAEDTRLACGPMSFAAAM